MKGLVVLVAGGASGLGKATVERFQRAGSKVVIADLPQSKGKELAEALGEESALFCPVDVTKDEDVSKALDACKRKFGRLDVVLNCAGVCEYFLTYDFKDGVPHPIKDFRRIMEINTVGTFNVLRLAAGLIGANKPNQDGQRGVIINVASTAAYDAPVGMVAQAASKGAVVALTRTAAKDLGPQGIRVCAIAPGFFDTPMLRDFVASRGGGSVPLPPKLEKAEDFAVLVESIVMNPALNGDTIKIGSL